MFVNIVKGRLHTKLPTMTTSFLFIMCTSSLFPMAGSFLGLLFPKYPVVKRVDSERELVNMDTVLSFKGLVERHGYNAEEHKLTTDDGYHLVLHRITASPVQTKTTDKPVVILQHGMLGSSDAWVLTDPQRDLGFVLADAGFDVWVTNRRGNTYCRSHETLTTLDRKFWQFSFHEIARHDLRNAIDYILNYTNQDNLNYIGHSMGGTIGYVLLSTMKDYNLKIRLFVSLAPPAFWRQQLGTLMSTIIWAAPIVKSIAEYLNIYDVLPQNSAFIKFVKIFCDENSSTKDICLHIFFRIVKANRSQWNTTSIPHILTHYPAGESMKTIFHYLQNIYTGYFEAFDYGDYSNFRLYKHEIPPVYNISRISTPVAVFYGTDDAFVQPVDVVETLKRLPNIVAAEKIVNYTHMDFLFALNAKTVVYDRIVQILRKRNVVSRRRHY